MANKEKSQPAEHHDSAMNTNNLAVERTVMAADRSLMAWVRTGLALIGFGFTIYKFLEYAREQLVATGREPGNGSSPKLVGLYLVGLGLLSLILGTLEHIQTLKNFRGYSIIKRHKYSLVMSGLVAIFGIALFLSILLRIIKVGLYE